MALESPLIQSPQGLISAFSPYSDSPGSPNLPKSPRFSALMASEKSADRSSEKPLDSKRDSLGAESASLKPAPSPIDYDPSPVTSTTSNGTEVTDIEDSPLVESNESKIPVRRPQTSQSIRTDRTGRTDRTDKTEITTIDTTVPASRERSNSDGTPQSVIHAPQGFQDFAQADAYENHHIITVEKPPNKSPPLDKGRISPPGRKTPLPQKHSDFPLRSERYSMISSQSTSSRFNNGDSPLSPPPITTAINPAKFPLENATPRAQTRHEVDLLEESSRKRPSSSLEDIPESQDQPTEFEYVTEDDDDDDTGSAIIYKPQTQSNKGAADREVEALKSALNECWTLCNTLAGLSSNHRDRIFNYPGSGDMHENAWKCCWKLCQKLYDSRDDPSDHHVRPTLELCREFCQALFDVRQRENEVADSVLRVSFELNNHLYNTHDRNLPEPFRERTLEFYITLCHRLMKQRSGLAEETDSLLRACWSMAEMLFSLRQNKREGQPVDEDILGSAVQACWELCDIFREGWTQVRPDRGTPRPSQTTFAQSLKSMRNDRESSSSSNFDGLSEAPVEERINRVPETPTTIFEDVPVSPDDAPTPNIIVLGTDNSRPPDPRWSSGGSTLSGYTQSSASNSTATASTEDQNIVRLKVLIVRAAMNAGFQRATGQSLNFFVKSMGSNSFGSLTWQNQLLGQYRHMILNDPTFRAPANLPSRHASAAEVARAVIWMVSSGQHAWLKDLYRLVFGFRIEDAEARTNVSIQT
ncbi:MAG: hypothetical protein M1814_005039 [Vezdaea aestivalis]|nr:MAG: hypothetical protein M1814_005039 [Vezdaea aestivalis]